MRLVKPTLKWEKEHRAYIAEWGKDRLTPSVFQLPEGISYEEYLRNLKIKEAGTSERLPSTSFFCVNSAERLVGMVDIRHKLNEFMVNVGGHIGYGVRPSERNKGYASWMLSEALKKTDELGVSSVLVTCDATNIFSSKVIKRNGGREDDNYIDNNGLVYRRFWIERNVAE